MRRRIALVLFGSILAACAPQPDSRTEVPATSPTETVAESTPPSTTPPLTKEPSAPADRAPASPRNVTIESVSVANPLVLRGTARTFENNVALRVRDARGAVISEGFTTARGEMGQFSPWEGTLWLTRDPGAQITVEALEYSAKDGSEQSLVARTIPFALEPVDATLYFADEGCTTVRAFGRTMPKSVSFARLLSEALVGGPTAGEKGKGAVGSFPEGSRVQSVILRDGVLTVDFNERLQNVGGACRAQMIRESVTRTLAALPSVRRVVITAGGSEALALQP